MRNFNEYHWKRALTVANLIPARKEGQRYTSAPEHGMHALRHFYASVLLDAGENIRALSQYLCHSDPGYTLRTYTHLMPAAKDALGMPLIRFSKPDQRRHAGSDNEFMDQGIAAALAGVAGLVGAGIGGLATAYGARVGAQKAVQAVQMQVQQQAAAEHRHWLRDQRRQVCSDITAAWAQIVMPAARCLTPIEEGSAIDSDRLHALGPPIDALADACALSPLWGPDSLIEAATRLREASSDFIIAISRWNDIRETGDRAAIDAQQQLCGTLRDAFASAQGQFLSAARRLLEGPD